MRGSTRRRAGASSSSRLRGHSSSLSPSSIVVDPVHRPRRRPSRRRLSSHRRPLPLRLPRPRHRPSLPAPRLVEVHLVPGVEVDLLDVAVGYSISTISASGSTATARGRSRSLRGFRTTVPRPVVISAHRSPQLDQPATDRSGRADIRMAPPGRQQRQPRWRHDLFMMCARWTRCNGICRRRARTRLRARRLILNLRTQRMTSRCSCRARHADLHARAPHRRQGRFRAAGRRSRPAG